MSALEGVKLFYGDDVFHMDKEISKLIGRALPEEGARSFNLEQIDGDNASIAQVLILAKSLPFMAKRRVVVVREPGFFVAGAKKKGLSTAEDEQALLDFCAAPNPESLLIFRYTTSEKPGAYLKKLIEACDSHSCMQPKGKEVMPWLRAEAKARDLALTPQALALFDEAASQMSTEELASELDKLALYLLNEEERSVDEALVKTLLSPVASLSIFNLTDAVFEGRAARALSALEDCLYQGSKPPQIMRQLLDTARRLLMVQSMLAEGMTLPGIRQEIGRQEFYVKKLINQSRRLSTTTLSRLYLYLVECDVKSKSTSGLDMAAYLEEIIINCCAACSSRR